MIYRFSEQLNSTPTTDFLCIRILQMPVDFILAYKGANIESPEPLILSDCEKVIAWNCIQGFQGSQFRIIVTQTSHKKCWTS